MSYYINNTTNSSYSYSIPVNNLTSVWADDTLTVSPSYHSLEVKGTSVFKNNVKIEGDLELNGYNIKDTLAKIEERLAILKPNKKLEEKWEKLRELGNQYRELEADILEKEEILRILKS